MIEMSKILSGVERINRDQFFTLSSSIRTGGHQMRCLEVGSSHNT